MALSSVNVTMNLADMLGTAFETRRTKVWVSTNVPGDTVIDTVGNAIRVGSGGGANVLAADGTATLSVWVPGTGSNPTSWQTSIHVSYEDPGTRSRKVRTFGPFTITVAADLADLVEEQEVPPEYATTLTNLLSGYADSASDDADRAEAARDGIVGDLGTTDSQTATLVGSPSLTQTALAGVSEDRVATFSVMDHGYTGANLAADTAAVQALIATVASRTVTQSGAAGNIKQGCEIVFPEGTFVLDALTLDKVSLTIRGAGPGTVIKYGGTAGGTLFHVTNSQLVEFTDMTVLGDAATPPANLFWFDTTAAPYVGANRSLSIRRCSIGRRYLTGGVTSDDGESEVAVRIGGATVANGDRWLIEDTTIYDASDYGLYIAHEQAVWGKLDNVHFRNCDVGFHSEANLNARDLHFTYCGTDISVGTSCWVSIDGYNSEESDLLIAMLASARLNIKRGKALLNAASMNGATYWADCQISNGGYLHLEDLWVSDETYATGPKLHCGGSSGPLPATVHIHDCLLPNGASDAGYDFDSIPTGTDMYVEVRQEGYFRRQLVESASAAGAVFPDAPADIQTFTASGTWTKPTVGTTVTVILIGGGGGGGAGPRQVSGAACSGGAGGGGGGFTLMTIPAAACASTVSVTVGAAAAGAATQTVDTTAGANGSNGVASLFGSHAVARGGGGGGGGKLAAVSVSGSGAAAGSNGGAGGAGANGGVGAAGAAGAGPGGGSGGGISTTPAFFAGGAGSTSTLSQFGAGAAGATDGANGGAATSAAASEAAPGGGGGGGAASILTTGGNGGAGGNYGAGGGGGGASLNTRNSGAGGAGAPGIVVVITA